MSSNRQQFSPVRLDHKKLKKKKNFAFSSCSSKDLQNKKYHNQQNKMKKYETVIFVYAAAAGHMMPLRMAHAADPMTAVRMPEKLSDGEEEGGCGIEPKTVG